MTTEIPVGNSVPIPKNILLFSLDNNKVEKQSTTIASLHLYTT